MKHELVYKLFCIQAYDGDVAYIFNNLIAWLNDPEAETEFVTNVIDLELVRERQEVQLWTVLTGHWSETVGADDLRVILATTIASLESQHLLQPLEMTKPASVDRFALRQLKTDPWFWDNDWSTRRRR